MKLFGKKKKQSCCSIRIEEVKAEDQKTACCRSGKTEENKEKAN